MSDWNQDYAAHLCRRLIHTAGFPATISPLLGETITDELHIFAEKLMSDALLPFAKTNFKMMGAPKRRSLYQELCGVAPSSHGTSLSSKSETRRLIGGPAFDPIEQHLGVLLGQLGFSRKS
jgi:hypothetical protein